MSVEIVIRKRDRCPKWLTMDMTDEPGIRAQVVVPLFGPNHLAGMDCWCGPKYDDGVIIHEAQH